MGIVVLLMSLCAAGQRTPMREIDKIDRFDKVSLASSINLTIVKGERQKISIRGERSVISKVVCQVDENRQLSIYTTLFQWKKSKRIDVVIETDSALWSIYGTSGNKVRCESAFESEQLLLSGNYGCDFVFNVQSEYVKVNVKSGCDVTLVGKAHKCDIFADNGCSVHAERMATYDVSVVATLSSKVDVAVTDVLYVSSSDACEVTYRGQPQTKSIYLFGDGMAVEE